MGSMGGHPHTICHACIELAHVYQRERRKMCYRNIRVHRLRINYRMYDLDTLFPQPDRQHACNNCHSDASHRSSTNFFIVHCSRV